MNSTTIPCPYEDRITSTELYIKLGIVLFIVNCSLAHLIYLRRDFRLAIVLLLCAITSPITVAVHLFLPIPILIVEFLALRDKDRLLQSIATLFGHEGNEERFILASEDGLELLSADDTESADGKSVTPGINFPWTLVQWILQLAVLFYSVALVFLFTWRHVVLFDHYILQLALIGILSSVLSLIQLILKPGTPEKSWLAFVAGRYASFGYFSPLLLVHLTILGFITALVARACGLNVKPAFDILVSALPRYFSIQTLKNMVIIMLCISWVPVLTMCLYLCGQLEKEFRFGGFYVLGQVPLWFAIAPLIWLMMDMIPYLGFSGYYNARLLFPALNYLDRTVGTYFCPTVVEWNKIATFSAVPIWCPCPAALKTGSALLQA